MIEKNNKNIKVAVLGATGLIGQMFVYLLDRHPWFNIELLTASESRSGGYYSNEVKWSLPFSLPESTRSIVLSELKIENIISKDIKIVFSALPSEIASGFEREMREQGLFVFSNSGSHRLKGDVPILIPEANPGSLEMIKNQGYPGKGFIVTNANCSTTGLAVTLAPLRKFGIREIYVSTYQSISGAGLSGLSAFDITGNAIPFIEGEEKKMVMELRKIFREHPSIYPHCVRIPVLFGHLETIWVRFDKKVCPDDIRDSWESFRFDKTELPSQPELPVSYFEEPLFPQHRQVFSGSPSGMQVFTGQLKKSDDMIGFSLLVNNLIRGGAGGSIQNAELFCNRYGG
ncbi:MAG: aspartate-semialdehyde dehydrogenase [Candidatus Aminicenantes bacterium]|nr:aspartate-semialdehyde dehydrogenase [Candidatus Aminicenantes bacterium]MCK5004178.1 aspartate-semialdehyde dehydrogenase [Candidatus Aminicenantes bacterium]